MKRGFEKFSRVYSMILIFNGAVTISIWNSGFSDDHKSALIVSNSGITIIIYEMLNILCGCE